MVDMSVQRIANNSLSASSKRTVATQVAKWLSIIGFLVGLLLGYAHIRDQNLMISYELERLKNANADLMERNQKLRVELNALMTPQEVERAAKSLGLISATSEAVIILQGDPVPKTEQTQLAQSRSRLPTGVLHE
jgi:hypothetical protein